MPGRVAVDWLSRVKLSMTSSQGWIEGVTLLRSGGLGVAGTGPLPALHRERPEVP